MTDLTLVNVPAHVAGSRLAFVKALKKDPCAYCALRSYHWREATVDHIVARGQGGPDRMDNMTGACPACNQRKGTRSLLLYLLARSGDC